MIYFSLFHLSSSSVERAFSSFFFDEERSFCLAVALLTVLVSESELELS